MSDAIKFKAMPYKRPALQEMKARYAELIRRLREARPLSRPRRALFRSRRR